MNNYAFIDWQNLHLWISSENWKIDYEKFRIYLKSKFWVTKAYYFLWFLNEDEQKLYNKLQESWFIVVFREHHSNMIWKKKWNVDVDIVFEIMKNITEKEDFEKIVLVSWDWDYIKMVKYLIDKNLLQKILFPNKKFSSLYKTPIFRSLGLNLSLEDVKRKIKL